MISPEKRALWRRDAANWKKNRVMSRVRFNDGTDAADVILDLLNALDEEDEAWATK